jgi:Flp pilus assembly protein TadG
VRRTDGRASGRLSATREGGAAAVEFALVAVLLLTIVFGILQYATYFWALQSGSNAAREAARQAAVGELTCDEFTAAVLANAQGEDASTVVAERTYYTDSTMATEATPAVVGGVVKVTVSFNSFDLNFPFVPFIDDGLVSEHGVARVENKTTNSVKCP